MKKIYQRIDDPRKGDCWKCTIATLLGKEYEEVPNFIEFDDDWFVETEKFFKENGYELGKYLYNPNACFLENPTANVYEDTQTLKELTLDAIKPEYGINGLFLASVYSPKYTNPNEHPIDHLHSVLCDINFNIVFDPQPAYEKVVNYPYAKLIGYNGIRGIDIIKKIG